MNRIKLNNRNKLKISTIMMSTILIASLFMIFGNESSNNNEVLLADTYETTNLTYVIEFNDEGYEYNRPESMKIGLYEDNNDTPIIINTLEKNRCRRKVCNITFQNVRENDDNGNPIHYIVREIGDYGYNVTYQETRIINDVNMKDVNIDLFDKDNNRIVDSVIAVIDSSRKEILTTTTSIKTSTIKLLRGQYTLTEKNSPKGYKRFKDIKFTLLDDGTLKIDGSIKNRFTITKDDLNIKINLVNEYNEVIPDIKIELVNLYDGNITKTTFSNTNDINVNKELDVDGEYKLTQLKEAFEYLNAEDVLFKFDKDNNIVINDTVQNTNRVVLVVRPAFYHLTIENKIEEGISNKEVFNYNIHIDNYNGILTSSKGDLIFKNGDSSFTLIPNEEISIKIPTYSKYTITNDSDYEKEIDGSSTGEVKGDIKVTFTNVNREEEIIVPAPITGINKLAYLLTSFLLVLLGFLVTLYYKKKKYN